MGEKKFFRGFTVIEVALVLAIGGLIFLMVFVALPGLRASQRDAERREGVNALLTAIKKYQSNNRGTLPGAAETASSVVNVSWSNSLKESTGNETTWRGFYRDYLGERFMDPGGVNYKLQVVKCGSNADVQCGSAAQLEGVSFPNDYKMLVVLQASCYGEKTIGTSNPRKLAVVYKLEGAGVYCSNT